MPVIPTSKEQEEGDVVVVEDIQGEQEDAPSESDLIKTYIKGILDDARIMGSLDSFWVYPDDPLFKTYKEIIKGDMHPPSPHYFYRPRVFVFDPSLLYPWITVRCLQKNCNGTLKVKEWHGTYRRVVDMFSCYYLATVNYRCGKCGSEVSLSFRPDEQKLATSKDLLHSLFTEYQPSSAFQRFSQNAQRLTRKWSNS